MLYNTKMIIFASDDEFIREVSNFQTVCGCTRRGCVFAPDGNVARVVVCRTEIASYAKVRANLYHKMMKEEAVKRVGFTFVQRVRCVHCTFLGIVPLRNVAERYFV